MLQQSRSAAAAPNAALVWRRGDPNAEGQDTFCPSDKEYPPFMRVNPILEWGYGDVWAFLRTTAVPYCSMYDQGYTSVGNVHNTHPNRHVPNSEHQIPRLPGSEGLYLPRHCADYPP